MKAFSVDTRRVNLERAAEGVDLLVVGAGITGAGVAREAALAGYRVLVADKGDFASGTSSRSSKLIHGGVRYLAQADVGLVKEAARERAVLRAIAPHLARPLRMLIPVGSRRAKLKMAAGLWTFDKLAGEANDEPHRVLDRDDTLASETLLRPDRVAGGVVYTEFATHDARLTLETILAAHAAGAWAANYVEVLAVEPGKEGVRATLEDRTSGERFEVNARCLVNAAGPWFDHVRGLSEPGAEPMLQLTRGIHLVFRRERLPVEHSVILRAPDGRSTFVVPRDGYVYLGTTDTHYEGAPEEPGVSMDDAAYLLASLEATFADPPGPADIVGTWSGVRPLLKQAGKSPSEISRRDEIRSGPGPIVSVAGGKLTTYRSMARRVLERASAFLGPPPNQGVDSATLALAGGDLESQRRARTGAPRLGDAKLEERLWGTYGVRAAPLIERIAADARAGEAIDDDASIVRAEVEMFVEQEMALALDDVLRRRTMLGLFDVTRAVQAGEAIARILAERLGWTPAHARRQCERFARDRIAELAEVQSVPAPVGAQDDAGGKQQVSR